MPKKSQLVGNKYLPSTSAAYGTPASLYPIIYGRFDHTDEAVKLSKVRNLSSEYDYTVLDNKENLRVYNKSLSEQWAKIQSFDFLQNSPPPKKREQTSPHTDMAKGISAFLAWRRHHGLNFLDMVNKTKISPKCLSEIENGRLMPSFMHLQRLCRVLGLHPVEVINFENRLSEGEVDLAVDAYNNQTKYSAFEGCQDDLRDALDEWVANDISYESLEDYWENLDEDDPENEALDKFLSKLLINDGNPNLNGLGIDRLCLLSMNGLKGLGAVFKEKAEMAMRQIDQIIAPIDLWGRTHQGPYWWPAYRDSVLLMFRHCGHTSKGFISARDYFYDSALIARPTELQKETLNDFINSLEQLSDLEQIHDVNEEQSTSLEIQEDTLGDFLEQYEDVLRNYAVRQAILSRTNIGNDYGNPDDVFYITKADLKEWTHVIPRKVKLLPPPSPSS